jgi:outer membrane protein OmpA-like peptidoglycan-associated protein
MNTQNLKPGFKSTFNLAAIALVTLSIVACSTGSTKSEGAGNARSKLTQLQSDPQLASRAPVAIQEAELAVRAAEKSQTDKEQEKHLAFIADRKVDIARAQAQSRLLEDQRKTLGEQRENARLDSRTQEADKARSDAIAARTDADIARSDANAARADAQIARDRADIADMDSQAALEESYNLQRQIAELNAQATDRGLVVTLGDVLFDTGRSNLKGGATSNLSKLAAFLNKYKDRTVMIEGHTDSLGSEDSNLGLSQRRAESVKSYLMGEGVASVRLNASGKGEGAPVSSNDSPAGRQQNRRVEVIIANSITML